MNTSDLLVIVLSIPMLFIIGILVMLNHEVKKSLRRASQNPTKLENKK
jgi:hypothetical protein